MGGVLPNRALEKGLSSLSLETLKPSLHSCAGRTLQKNSSVGSLKEGTKLFPLQDPVMPCMGDLNLKLGCVCGVVCVWSCNREE